VSFELDPDVAATLAAPPSRAGRCLPRRQSATSNAAPGARPWSPRCSSFGSLDPQLEPQPLPLAGHGEALGQHVLEQRFFAPEP
jgi:hypothetical protein